MVPVRLSLKNFLSYGDSVPPLDFKEFSIACLSGKNGHGKSALIDAMTWALWGKCRVKNKDEVIKRGASESGVEFEFEVEGNLYRILRSIKRGRGSQSTGSLQLQIFDRGSGDFKPLAQDNKARTEVEKVLKMDYDSFICSSFILQGRADEFTKRTPAERKEILGSILELDKYERLARKARELALRSGVEEESLRREENQIGYEIGRKEELLKKLEEVKAKEEELTGELLAAEKSYEALIRELEAINAKMEIYDGLIRDRKETEENSISLDQELNKITAAIERDKEVIAKEGDILEGYEQLEKAREKEKVYSEKLMVYTKLLREGEKLERAITEERYKIEKRVSSLKGKERELQRRLDQVGELIKREKEIVDGFKKFLEVESRQGEFERKKQLFDELKTRSNQLENEIQRVRFRVEAQIKEVESRIKDLRQRAGDVERLTIECEILRAKIRDNEGIRVQAEALKETLKKIGESKKESSWKESELKRKLEEERQKLAIVRSEAEKAQCPLCESPLEEEARKALMEKFERSINELQNARREELEKFSSLGEEENGVISRIKQIESGLMDISILSKELGEKEKTLADSKSALGELETAGKELEYLKDTLGKENFALELREEYKKLKLQMEGLDYKESEHEELRRRLEALRSFQVEHRLLEEAQRSKGDIEKELAHTQKDIAYQSRLIDQGLYALEHKDKLAKIKIEIDQVGYDEEKHKEIKSTLHKLERFSREKENLNKAKVSLTHRERERDSIQKRINEDRERIQRIEKEIKNLEEVVSQSRDLEDKRNAFQEKIFRYKRDKDTVLEEKSRVFSELERIIKLEDRRGQVLKQIEKLGYDLTVYQELEKAFGKNGIQALIIENAVPEIEVEANNLLSKLTEGTMTLSLEMLRPTQKGGDKETLDIKIADSSGTRSYETYSGGEAFRIDFALRVAISKFIANRSGAQLRTLVIDEGFGTQDKDGLGQFIQVINAIKDDFDKILVITHVDDLKDKFPVRIEVTKEPGRGSSFEVLHS